MKKIILGILCVELLVLGGGLFCLPDIVVKADAWEKVTPYSSELATERRERNERVIKRDFPKPITWKIILRERLSKDEVYYLLEDTDGKRVDFKPCGLGKNYIVGEKVKVSQKGPSVGADDDFECSLDIYRE